MQTCFVVMAIGDQKNGDTTISSADLKKKYDDLIKEAIKKARPDIEVTRADEVAIPGTMSTDIITRIMHSTYVVVDVSYPNPNVFYEMGLRHACKPGTVIIKEKNAPTVPFDISHLRYIEYESTPSGLKTLADSISKYFDVFDKNPDYPDNHLLEIAKLTKYKFPNYNEDKIEPETKIVMEILKSPEIIKLLTNAQNGEDITPEAMISALMSNPSAAQSLIDSAIKAGFLKFDKSKSSLK